MRVRKIPLRKCVACHNMMPKKQLVRVVRTPEDEIEIDLTGKKAGRGAYLCGQSSCFKLAKKQKAFDHALKHAVQPNIYDLLEQQFALVEDQFKAHQKGASNDN